MLDGILTQAEVLRRVEGLMQAGCVLGPVARMEPECDPPVRYFYEPIARVADLALDFTYCVYGPKGAVLPPRETLFQFRRQNGGFEAVAALSALPTAVVGVHPCDLHGLRLLDEVFRRDVADEHYAARRAKLFIVGVDCARPCTKGVFCGDLGTNEAESGFDVMLYALGDAESAGERQWGVRIGSDAGRAWLGREGGSGKRGAVERRFERYREAKSGAFPPVLALPKAEIPVRLDRAYDSLLWEATAQRCYSCGSCNLVCPTCYCFDIQDEPDLGAASGRRERCWDGCMLRDFALVAGGHNFRAKAGQRLRHRIMRKGTWIERRTGLPGCVGCARCDRACTAHISIVEILNQLAEARELTSSAR